MIRKYTSSYAALVTTVLLIFGAGMVAGHFLGRLAMFPSLLLGIVLTALVTYKVRSSVIRKDLRTRILRSNERKLYEALEIAGLGTWDMDVDSGRFHWSPEFCRLVGLTRQPCHLSLDTFLEFVHPQDRERVQQSFQTALENTGSYSMEHRIVRPDGEERIVQARATSTCDGFGKPDRMVGTITDITQAKKADQDLERKTSFIQILRLLSTAANQASSLEEAMETSLVEICERTDWDVGHAWLPAEDGMLVSSDLWKMQPGDPFENLRDKNIGKKLQEGVGLPGRVLASRQPVWIDDVSQDALFCRESIAREFGIMAAFAFPITVDQQIVAVLEFFSRRPRSLDEQFLGMMAHAGSQLGRVVERQSARDALQRRLEIEGLIAQASARFIHLSGEAIDGGVRETLLRLENFIGASRTCLFEFHDDYSSFAVTHEVCSHGVPALHSPHETLTAEHLPWFLEQLRQHREVMVARREDLPPEAAKEARLMRESGTMSLLLVPMVYRGKLRGFLACNTLEEHLDWPDDVVRLLRIISQIITNMLENRRAHEALRKAKENLEKRVVERTSELAQAKEEAESANRAKSEFLANMSHELRTPLNGILGYAQILAREEGLNEKQVHGLEIIRQAGENLLTLINDILDLAKVEAGKMELEETTFNLDEMLRGLTDLFRLRAQDGDISFEWERAGYLPTYVHGDERKLRQVLMNLLSNAMKFTREGGVELKVGQDPDWDSELDPEAPPQIRFEVIDSGVGIAKEAQELIFQSFERAVAHRHGIEGTGLGLAISARLTQMMGGALQVDSQLGKGSSFFFSIPMAEMDKPVVERPVMGLNITGYRGERKTILVVDDKWENRTVITHMLAPLGFNILEAPGGKEGLKMALEHQPAAVLLDLRMPDMDGFEVMRRLRARPEGRDQVIITISASVFEHNREDSLKAGSDDFLAKPFRLEQLLELLGKHMRIEWIYQKECEDPVIENASMIIPDDDTLSKLQELARRGNVRGLSDQLSELAESNAQYTVFAQHLKKLCKGFKLKEIRTFLEEHIPHDMTAEAVAPAPGQSSRNP